MQMTSIKAIVAALAIVSLATACTSRHEETKVVGQARKASVGGATVSPAQLALNDEMKHYQDGFDFSNVSLAAKITGLSISSIDVVPTVDGVYYLKGNLTLAGQNSLIALSSDAISEADLRKGALIPVNFDGQAASAVLGSPLIIKARCIDENCRSVSMWLSTSAMISSSMDSSEQATSSAGFIFSGKTGAYSISASQTGLTVSAQAALNRPFDGDKK